MANFMPDFKLSSAGVSVWCPMADTQIYVMPDGDVCPCTFTQISFGNLLKEDMQDILLKMRESSLITQLDRSGQCPISMGVNFIKKVNETLKDGNQFPLLWEDVKENFEAADEKYREQSDLAEASKENYWDKHFLSEEDHNAIFFDWFSSRRRTLFGSDNSKLSLEIGSGSGLLPLLLMSI